MDTGTPTDQDMLQMMYVIAKLERILIVERVKAELEVSKKHGKRLGSTKIQKISNAFTYI